MAINNIKQPDLLHINSNLRLRKFDNSYDFALPWYQDEEIVKLVDGKCELYDMERLGQMYHYLDNLGELYFIEILDSDHQYVPIGDVTFCKEDMPIVIGVKEYWNKGIGKLIVLKLIERAKTLGYDELSVNEIYNYNIASQKLFESVGYVKSQKTQQGWSYNLKLIQR